MPLKILIIKLTSLGDLIHTFPALTEAQKAFPDAHFDWLVDENFVQIPGMHPTIKNIISVPLRQKKWKAVFFQILKLRKTHRYDLIIDAQGLIKSAVLALFLKGEKHGLNKNSARESFASFFYNKTYDIPKNQHAIDRTRQLFSEVLKYPLNFSSPLDYGIVDSKLGRIQDSALHNHPHPKKQKTILFLHGTTWETKHWPEIYWIQLGQKLSESGFEILIPWGNTLEKKRAEFFNTQFKSTVLPKLSLLEFKTLLQNSVTGIVAQDTGLTHLAAALNIPTVSLYGPTDPRKTGPKGQFQKILSAKFECAPCLSKICTYTAQSPYEPNIQPPCFGSIPPQMVYDSLLQILESS